MGFFGNLGDALSGKIYKQNTLVGSNVIRLTKKVEARPQSDFVKQWVYSCVAGINALVNNLLFEDIKDKEGNDSMTFADGAKQSLNPFKQNVGKLDEQKVFEIFKLLGGYHLAIFIQNEDNLSFLKKVDFDAAKFEEEIFTIFDFTRADEATYQKLKEKFIENPAGYFITLYREVFNKAFGMPDESNLAASMIFSDMLTNAHLIFMQILNEQIKEIRRKLIFADDK